MAALGVVVWAGAIVAAVPTVIGVITRIQDRVAIAAKRAPLFDYWDALQKAKASLSPDEPEKKKGFAWVKAWAQNQAMRMAAYLQVVLAPTVRDIGETGLEVAAAAADVVGKTKGTSKILSWIGKSLSTWLGKSTLGSFLAQPKYFETLKGRIEQARDVAENQSASGHKPTFRETAKRLTEELNEAVKRKDVAYIHAQVALFSKADESATPKTTEDKKQQEAAGLKDAQPSLGPKIELVVEGKPFTPSYSAELSAVKQYASVETQTEGAEIGFTASPNLEKREEPTESAKTVELPIAEKEVPKP